MPSDNVQETARALAARPYTLFVFLDKTTSGGTIYVATNLELPSCYAQGDTIQEAEEILAEVREDYIAHLLERGLAVPEPTTLRATNYEPIENTPFGYRILEPKPDDGKETADLVLQTAVFA